MRRVTYICTVLCFICFNSFATQWSISNHPANPGQFNSIPSALASPLVAEGDTFLIHPTGLSYLNFTLNKKFTFVGGGFNTQNGETVRSNIGQVFITSVNASGSEFYGLVIGYVDIADNLGNVHNLKFENCHFDARFGPNQNGIRTRQGAFAVNLFIKNCRFETSSYTAPLKFDQNGGPTGSSVYVTNSWFSNGGGESSIADNRGILIFNNCTFVNTKPLLNVKFATFQNCIFNFGTFGTELTDNVFNYCIAKDAALPPPNNTGSNNISNTAVIFIPNTLKLAPNSPGYTGGSDGQQMGIYGGSSTYNSAGEPLITPITRYLNLSNTTVPYNGSVNINLLVTKPLKN
jgi:hypothetical protein